MHLLNVSKAFQSPITVKEVTLWNQGKSRYSDRWRRLWLSLVTYLISHTGCPIKVDLHYCMPGDPGGWVGVGFTLIWDVSALSVAAEAAHRPGKLCKSKSSHPCYQLNGSPCTILCSIETWIWLEKSDILLWWDTNSANLLEGRTGQRDRRYGVSSECDQ